MIDIETLGTSSKAAIVQIGYADTDGVRKEWNIDLNDAIANGVVDGSTIGWWISRPKDAQAAVFGEPLTTMLQPALMELNTYLRGAEYVWSHATFDIPILNNAFKELGLGPAWNFRNLRDLRTIEHFYGKDIEWEKREGTHHTALADADYQLKHLIKMLEKGDH